jgi:transposase-like protein
VESSALRQTNLHDVPEKITIDKSGANTAAIESVKADACVDILMRQNKYLNNIVVEENKSATFVPINLTIRNSVLPREAWEPA